MLAALSVAAQQTDSVKKAGGVTQVTGQVTDAATGLPLPYISITFTGSRHGVNTDKLGNFRLSAQGNFSQVTFSHLGYLSITKTIQPAQLNELEVKLHSSQTQLKEVAITSAKRQRYRNKGNPAVSLIQQIINHKDENRMESSDYLQYDQYERIGLSFFNLSQKFINGSFFSKYKFMLDTTLKINGKSVV